MMGVDPVYRYDIDQNDTGQWLSKPILLAITPHHLPNWLYLYRYPPFILSLSLSLFALLPLSLLLLFCVPSIVD